MVSVVEKNLSPVARDLRYRIGVSVALAGILMMFTALTSAYIVRSGAAPDWQPIAMPRVLLLSTFLLVVSSGTLEVARRKLSDILESGYRNWLLTTAILGFAFLVLQVLAWQQLASQGVFVATNPHSSFFYLLTALHGLHLLGGLLALVYLHWSGGPKRSKAQIDAVSIYWHFMGALWIFLFLLLFLRR